LQGTKHFIADLGLDAHEIKGGHIDRASGSHALAWHVEELPVEIETLVRTEKVSREDEINEKLLAYAQWIELLRRDGHERAGGLRLERSVMTVAR